MRSRSFDPRRLDVAAFCRESARLEGALPVTDLPRLHEAVHEAADVGSLEPVAWHLEGTLREPVGAAPQPWLHVFARARLALVCQRCLAPVDEVVEADRWFRFERDEDAASALDAEVDEDVLVLGGRFDAIELIEDELLLSLPLVPRHADCRHAHAELAAAGADALPASGAVEGDGVEMARPNPFAALVALKRQGPSDEPADAARPTPTAPAAREADGPDDPSTPAAASPIRRRRRAT